MDMTRKKEENKEDNPSRTLRNRSHVGRTTEGSTRVSQKAEGVRGKHGQIIYCVFVGRNGQVRGSRLNRFRIG